MFELSKLVLYLYMKHFTILIFSIGKAQIDIREYELINVAAPRQVMVIKWDGDKLKVIVKCIKYLSF
jgi:hypothetical protein